MVTLYGRHPTTVDSQLGSATIPLLRRKMEDQRRQAAEKKAAARRATDAQVLEDAERLIGAWNERQAKRMPMLFSPTIGTAITAGYWFLWVRCPGGQTRLTPHNAGPAWISQVCRRFNDE